MVFLKALAILNCMATADRAVVVFVKEFQWDQRPRPLQNGLIHHSLKNTLAFKKNPVITEVETQLFPIHLKFPQCF